MNEYHLEAESVDFKLYDPETGRNNRNGLVQKYSPAIPDDKVIATLASMGPIIELGARNGYWSRLITEAGGTIEAYDPNPVMSSSSTPRWFPVRRGKYDAITREHRNSVLLLVWPDYHDEFASNCLRNFAMFGGAAVVLVGEGRDGFNASGDFFDVMDGLFKMAGKSDIPRWEGVHDDLTLYLKK